MQTAFQDYLVPLVPQGKEESLEPRENQEWLACPEKLDLVGRLGQPEPGAARELTESMDSQEPLGLVEPKVILESVETREKLDQRDLTDP